MRKRTGPYSLLLKAKEMETNPDFYYRDNSSAIFLLPQNSKAEEWARDNLHLEKWQDIECIGIEPRMFSDILEGIEAGGMLIEKSKP